jgi:hypothetical protein
LASDALNNTIVVLIGFAGTGKYTIGLELCERTAAKLIDNHLMANLVLTVLGKDGPHPMPSGVSDKIKQIRRTVYQSIREFSSPEMSFVFTVDWGENNPADLKAFEDLAELAVERRSRFVPIRLICGIEELCRRVVDPSRVAMQKEISSEMVRKKCGEDSVLLVPHPNLRTLDVTKRSASGSVDAILDEIRAIKSFSRKFHEE